MKALYLIENSKIKCLEVEKPKVEKKGDILMKIVYTGTCGSDYVRFFENQAKKYPIILTHEFCGIVEDNNNSNKFSKGDYVAAIPLIPDFEDEESKKGNYSLCKNYGFIGSRQDGGLQEYIVLNEKNLIKLPKDLELKKAGFLEPITVVLHGLKIAKLKEIDIKKIAIIGMGTIGILALQILKYYGYDVSCFDIDEEKLRLSKKFGANRLVNNKNIEELKLNYNEYDLVIETSGATQSFYISNSLAAKKGEILYIGTPHENLLFDFKKYELINRKELTIKGSWMNYSKPWPGNEWTEALELLRKGAIIVEDLIGKYVTLDTFETILEDYKNRKISGKIVVKVSEI
ncbi:zinc-binding dehydrogenase [Oceanivirga salmonicida]|uniref:zinc-binding dehydrogenase n=1 Tax=Oceanivirga salmonicida TaxID=1769291 RepID=UPI0008346E03|nr:alcohol dehydrogenase catalytic domain-containing protein [Oceanivirga salmonicida]